jgi:hypothetical protein
MRENGLENQGNAIGHFSHFLDRLREIELRLLSTLNAFTKNQK